MKSRVLNIPIEVMVYVFSQKLRKPFRVFLYLKAISSGKIHKDSDEFRQAMEVLDIKDARTFNKYFDALLKENWIGYNPGTGMIFIRGFDFIRRQHAFSRHRMAQFYFESDIIDLDAFMFGAIVGDRVLRHKDYREIEKREAGRTATKKRGVARQILSPSSIPDYYGLAVSTMGKTVGLSQTRAHELKIRAEKAGYLKCNNKFREVATMENPDRSLKSLIAKGDPELAKKIRFGSKMIEKKKVIIAMEQLYDEVIPLIDYKSYRLKKKFAKKFSPTSTALQRPPLWALWLKGKMENGVIPPNYNPEVLKNYAF